MLSDRQVYRCAAGHHYVDIRDEAFDDVHLFGHPHNGGVGPAELPM